MLSLSFSSFMLVLLFILLFINDAIAHTDKGKQNFVVNEAGNDIVKAGRNHLSVEKEVIEFEGITPASIQFASDRVGGRKTMLEQRNMKQSTKKIKAMPSKGQGKLRMQSKLNGRNSHSDNVKVNRGSFTAFSADYHMPRTHPPKNN
ncbi:PREDICTED: uncharacterized protein LOC109218655 [Nicotiana attenuata]|uniref:Root meristem growth factor 1 n=1 Tax=Nicotiana attenuata TaxID=49451 RepID=A0A1J6KR59_NICAT|nr:PREDICTED: uncharacterized protein LOC109218655 [Nicotiana attenuata]OIT21641.1 hypothetical protein A4A49_35976 [Nicotiana attenuata]